MPGLLQEGQEHLGRVHVTEKGGGRTRRRDIDKRVPKFRSCSLDFGFWSSDEDGLRFSARSGEERPRVGENFDVGSLEVRRGGGPDQQRTLDKPPIELRCGNFC